MLTKQKNRGSVKLTVTVLVVFIVLVIAGFAFKLNQPHVLSQQELQANGAVLLETPRRFSEFQLTNQRGSVFDKESLKGKWSLLFFGFTHCPDICPTAMAAAAKMYAGLEPGERENLQVVLISLDPERDTTDKLAEYVPYFNPEFIGATGNQYVLLKLATELNVAFTKVELEGGDYTIDHSGNMVLVNPYGDYHGFLKPPFAEEQMRSTLRSIMTSFQH